MRFVEIKKVAISENYYNEVREIVTHQTETSITVEVWEGGENEFPAFARTGQKAPENFFYLRIGWKEAFDAAQLEMGAKNLPKTYEDSYPRETVSSLGEAFLKKGISENTFSEWLNKMVCIYKEFSAFYGGPYLIVTRILGEKEVMTPEGDMFMKDGTTDVRVGDKIRKFQYWWIPV